VGEARAWDPVNGVIPNTGRGWSIWAGNFQPMDYESNLRIAGTAHPMNSVNPTLADGRGSCFGSEHGGGANFLMGDGSVQFISETIDLNIYAALAGRNDGIAASLP
jgi:prepilin-type processing-associated H-X9-DG protein